jgi:hypothetical protein
MPEEPESLSLSELQANKGILEGEAHHLRTELQELARGRPDGWQAQFTDTQGELIAIAGRIGALDRRVRSLVEKKAGPAREEDDNDV